MLYKCAELRVYIYISGYVSMSYILPLAGDPCSARQIARRESKHCKRKSDRRIFYNSFMNFTWTGKYGSEYREKGEREKKEAEDNWGVSGPSVFLYDQMK